MNMAASIEMGKGKYQVVSVRDKTRIVNKAERDQLVKELYNRFEEQLIENVLDYGRTIRSLGEGERIAIRANISRCEECGIPEVLELYLSAKLLSDYNAGKMDRDTALKKIEINRVGKQ
jgi:hypothetical protein